MAAELNWQAQATLTRIARERLVKIAAEFERLKAERADIESWLAAHPEPEMCGDCYRPVAEHANYCPHFRWPDNPKT